MGNWQPISTAPRDGRYIAAMIVMNGHEPFPIAARYHRDSGYWSYGYRDADIAGWAPIPEWPGQAAIQTQPSGRPLVPGYDDKI